MLFSPCVYAMFQPLFTTFKNILYIMIWYSGNGGLVVLMYVHFYHIYIFRFDKVNPSYAYHSCKFVNINKYILQFFLMGNVWWCDVWWCIVDDSAKIHSFGFNVVFFFLHFPQKHFNFDFDFDCDFDIDSCYFPIKFSHRHASFSMLFSLTLFTVMKEKQNIDPIKSPYNIV